MVSAPRGRGPGHRRLGLGLLWVALAACAGRSALPVAAVDRSSQLYKARLQAQLDAVLDAAGEAPHLGALVVDAADDSVLYERNAEQRFVPASAAKLFTAAAALYYLGPAYRFTTDLLATIGPNEGRQVGDLFLRGSGDPGLRDSHLRDLAQALRARGVLQVSGDLVVDDGAFEALPWGRGWTWDDLAKGYGTPVSGVNAMHNAVLVELRPGRQPGAPTLMQMSPSTSYVEVVNETLTGPPLGPPRIRVQQPRADAVGLELGDRLVLQGSLPFDPNAAWSRRFAVRQAGCFAGQLLRQELQAQGIEVVGVVRRGSTPPEAQQVARHASSELATLLTAYMKASDNHGMECLLKRLGAAASSQPGSFANGLQAVRDFLQREMGIDVHDLRLADGSGDSRYSEVTPTQLVRLLNVMRRSFAVGPEFVTALPMAGADGTLRNRLVEPEFAQAVRAKTGTMTSVSSLAGYLITADAQVLTYAIMSEGAVERSERQRALQDRFLKILSRAR